MLIRRSVTAALVSLCGLAAPALAQPLTNSFTFQGELKAAGNLANGLHDFRFRLFDAASGGAQVGATLCSDNVQVTDGKFSVALDFGAQFTGNRRFVEVEVRADTGLACGNLAGFVAFTTRQELTASPYALYSLSAAAATNATTLNGQASTFYTNASNLASGTIPSARFSGNYTNALNLTNVANTYAGTFTGTYNGNGSNLTGLWRLTGNAGTTPGTNYLGTSDNQPLELRANAIRALRIEPVGTDTFNFIGGSQANEIGVGVQGATISGGGSTFPMDEKNQVTGNFGTVGGGLGNVAAASGFVGGGFLNRAGTSGSVAGGNENWALGGSGNAVAGGQTNRINTNGALVPTQSFIGGGVNNDIAGSQAVIAGGSNNTSNGFAATIAGGGFNTANGDNASVLGGFSGDAPAQFSTVAGGDDNTAGGVGSFAAGSNAKVRTAAQVGDADGDQGTFVWADRSVVADFTSSGPNQFLIRAQGGVGINQTVPGATLDVAGSGAFDLTTSGTTLQATNNTSVSAFIPEIAGASIEGRQTNTTSGSWVTGVRGYNLGTGGFGVGVAGIHAGTGFGVYGKSGTNTTGYAGYFQGRVFTSGNLECNGTMSKGAGSFKIDHPLDPKNKYLYHSFVESPDMMNIYNGNVVTDDSGYATITLPDWFDALNKEFRYQLTVIDEADDSDVLVWAKVVRKVKDNRFTIRTAKGNVEVSWQVTGIRKDKFAEKNRIPVEVEKEPHMKGRLLHPEAFGEKPEDAGLAQTQAALNGGAR